MHWQSQVQKFFKERGGGWGSVLNLNFFQGECSLDDRELTFSYVKNMIFIYCSEIILYLRFDHIWCDLWLQVINMMYSRGFILIQDFEQWSRYIWYWIIQKFIVFLSCIALKMLTFNSVSLRIYKCDVYSCFPLTCRRPIS